MGGVVDGDAGGGAGLDNFYAKARDSALLPFSPSSMPRKVLCAHLTSTKSRTMCDASNAGPFVVVVKISNLPDFRPYDSYRYCYLQHRPLSPDQQLTTSPYPLSYSNGGFNPFPVYKPTFEYRKAKFNRN